MNGETIYTIGEPLEEGTRFIPRILEMIRAAEKHPFVTFLEVRERDSQQIAVLEFRVELPQNPPVDIRRSELIAIQFSPNDHAAPWVFALRKDFPETLHQNLVAQHTPRSLCVFDEYYQDIHPRLTPIMLLERIADWLARAAVEELHDTNQPIEPLLISSDQIIFDDRIFDDPEQAIFVVERLPGEPLLLNTYQLPEEMGLTKLPPDHSYVMMPITVPPWHSRIIHYRPSTLADLNTLLADLRFDLAEALRSFITNLSNASHWHTLQRFKLIILLKLPKTRTEGGDVETPEWWAFLVTATIKDLGIDFGLFDTIDGTVGVLLEPEKPKGLYEVNILPLKPIFQLSRLYTQLLSGLTPSTNPTIVAVGAGALGSQVIFDLARQGIGQWHIVDDDRLMPHNSSRHALSPRYVGINKADALAFEVQQLLHDPEAARAYPVNFLTQETEIKKTLLEAVNRSNMIVDFSTSHAVSRYIAHIEAQANRVIAFLGPSGNHLVVVSTGTQSKIRLDDLEIQLAAAVANCDELHNLYSGSAGVVTYAGSCRDASVQMPQDHVALFAAVAAQFIKHHIVASEADIRIWEWSEQTLSLQHFEIDVDDVYVITTEGWTIRVSDRAVHDMQRQRENALPNETGGVLVGRIDLEYRAIYIGMALQSPLDSVEQPDGYVRGIKELGPRLEKIASITGGDMQYIGEWHSHPRGHSSEPSSRDREAHAQLIKEMGYEGLPGLVAIQGEELQPYFLIGLDD